MVSVVVPVPPADNATLPVCVPVEPNP
jgi:hypothetical protein